VDKPENIDDLPNNAIDETITPYKKLSDGLIIQLRHYTATFRAASLASRTNAAA
jgi:hypothetical protein